ncbi:tail fiber domain-containing protein [Pollutibacter soli]|uniref:tail fiber domain-containing protein n=1 Tax=Pollutibacter soli TaxID=3034157 RepID=UPI003013FE09
MKLILLIIITSLCTLYHNLSIGQANTSLSNLLAPVGITTNFNPGTNASLNLGSDTKSWKNIYLFKGLYIRGNNIFSHRIGDNLFAGANAGNSNANVNSAHGFGYSALKSISTGYGNTAAGAFALTSNTTGERNTAAGSRALMDNTSGSYNSALGAYALQKNIDGNDNTAIGTYSLCNNTTGNNNVGVGTRTLYANIEGGRNVGAGYNALSGNTTGDGNVALGFQSQLKNQAGRFNVAAGAYSLFSNITGLNNTALGNNSLLFNTGSGNTAIGSEVLTANQKSFNTGVGRNSLYKSGSASGNTAIGALSGAAWNNIGSNNTFIGVEADAGVTGGWFESIAIGYKAKITLSHQVRVGNGTTVSIGGFQNWSTFINAQGMEDVREDIPGLKIIKALKPVTYGWSAESGLKQNQQQRSTGFLAQDLFKIAKAQQGRFMPVLEPQNESGYYSIQYESLVLPLIKSLQELNKREKESDKEIQALQKEIAELKSAIELSVHQAKRGNGVN